MVSIYLVNEADFAFVRQMTQSFSSRVNWLLSNIVNEDAWHLCIPKSKMVLIQLDFFYYFKPSFQFQDKADKV